jgi:hypothetical protein
LAAVSERIFAISLVLVGLQALSQAVERFVSPPRTPGSTTE